MSVLSEDEIEKVLWLLDGKSLARAACVCSAWRDAFRRIARMPQWVSTLSKQKDLSAAVAAACGEAMAAMRMRPQVAFVFFSKEHVNASKQRVVGNCMSWDNNPRDKLMLPELLRVHLPAGIPIIGCSGEAIVATARNSSPVEIHGTPGLSSRRRDGHLADALSPLLLTRLLKVGGGSRMTASSPARPVRFSGLLRGERERPDDRGRGRGRCRA